MNSTRGFSEVRKDPEGFSRPLVLGVCMTTTRRVPFLGQLVAEGGGVEATKRDLRGEPGMRRVQVAAETFA